MSHLTAVPDDEEDHESEERYAAISAVPEAVARLQELKAEKADIEAEILFCEVWIDEHVKESTIVDIGEKQYKTTPVRGTQTNVDTKRMQRLVPDVYKRVVKTEEVEKVDVDQLVKEIELGNIPVKLMGQFITQKPKKTSIRLTEHKPRDDQEETTMSEKRTAIDDIAKGLDESPEEQPEEQEGPDHSLTELFLGEDSVEVKISHTVTVAGKDHFVGTTTNFRAMPGENQYSLGERVADFALEMNFAVAAQFRDMKTAEIHARKAAAESNPSKK